MNRTTSASAKYPFQFHKPGRPQQPGFPQRSDLPFAQALYTLAGRHFDPIPPSPAVSFFIGPRCGQTRAFPTKKPLFIRRSSRRQAFGTKGVDCLRIDPPTVRRRQFSETRCSASPLFEDVA